MGEVYGSVSHGNNGSSEDLTSPETGSPVCWKFVRYEGTFEHWWRRVSMGNVGHFFTE
jgi:hypothetical protein